MSRRTDKIARSLQVHLAELINYHLNDPRVELMVTVTEVEVSPDLTHARAMLTALNTTEGQLSALLAALKHASGRLRGMLADRIDMRSIPQLDFRIDVQAIRARETLKAIELANREREAREAKENGGAAMEEENDAATRRYGDAVKEDNNEDDV